MPAAGKLTPDEKAVCLRVRTLRNLAGESQQRLAQFTGLTRDQVANIETGRTILGFWAGWHLCRVFNVNQRYLATGVEPINPFLQFNPLDLAVPIGESESFLNVYLGKISSEISNRLTDYESAVVLENAVPLYATDQGHKVKARGGSKPMVYNAASVDTICAVSSEIPTWKQIVAALKRLTDSPGAKTQLAADLKTSRQNVNKWLSGAGAPSAELTLQVLRWVKDHGGWKT